MKQSIKLRLTAVIGLLSLLAPCAYGHEEQADTVISSTRTIDEVTVTARRDAERDLLPVQTLTGEQLERMSAHSVADAIRYFSGVQIKDYGGVGGLKTVNIRGMGTLHVGVFYDGIELGNAQNGQIDLGRFSLDNSSSRQRISAPLPRCICKAARPCSIAASASTCVQR